ncbi:MAG: aminopeptidase P family protein [Flavobacteriales bacterium]|jgi:Xaa-Pro aminopeptidase|nr:aminopeptidase P family protein [Flavobacteriales bacterium]
MKYLPIDVQLFINNRKRFKKNLKENSLAVFNSNDIYNTGADSTLPFSQHRDIFHLSGVDQEESILVIFPSCKNTSHKEILFLKETNEHIAVWEGEKLTKKRATEVSGISTIYWLNQFESIFRQLVIESENVYLNANEHLRTKNEMETREDRFVKKFKSDFPNHSILRSAPIMHKIRSIKDPLEIELMQKACDITEKGFRRILKFVKTGKMEYEIEAELMHEFLSNRSKGFAYSPIIASGSSACVLHYGENNKSCNEGDVILMDFGAEYANYSSDLTRCVPVNGKFTSRQKEVYNSVLRVKNDATELLKPGVLLNEYHKMVGEIMEKELIKLQLISNQDVKNQDPNWPAYKKYFMHGTSHYIGLDTHDLGSWTNPIEENMVFTVEPGIYIPEEGLGIRLEDDVVVQKNGNPINLMKNIPIEADEIEELMN